MSAPYAEVIGDPIAQSKSPTIHNFWLRKLGLEAEYRAECVTSEGLASYLAGRRHDTSWRGCNVTMPHKQAVISLLDELSDEAQAIGSVNTITRRADGALQGYNTDAAGFLEPLQKLLAADHLFRMARIVGTGGAARAIVHALQEHGFTIVLTGRDPAKARSLLDGLAPGGEHHTPPLSHFAEATDFAFDDREGCLDLIVNASPLGMDGHDPLTFDISHAPPNSIFYDIVTAPVHTTFLADAKARDFRTIDGLAMLIGQAARAFALFFGQPAPRKDDARLRELLAQ